MAAKHGAKCVHCGSEDVCKGGEKAGLQRWKCNECGKRTTAIVRDESTGIDRALADALFKQVRGAKGVQRYVITAAQNATPINKPFFASLQIYCTLNEAQLVVIPYRYKNPTSMWSAKAEHDDWWAPELAPYLLDRRIKLNSNLMLLADIKTQPTATSPLQGFESMTGALSAIIGHPKLELATVATPHHKLPKIMTTTGAVTQRNYLPSKAGKKGEFHHTFGACFVEIKGSVFHMRQLNAVKDGSFQDLTTIYTPAGTMDGTVAALILGDEHQEFVDPGVVKATFGEGGMVDHLKPKYVVRHDIHDFYSRNHHHIGEGFIDYVKHQTGADDVYDALKKTFAYVDKHTRPWVTNVFVTSNHPAALAKWVKRADWRSDLRNARFLLETALVMMDGSKMGDAGVTTIDPFVYWARRELKTAQQAVFLKGDESFQVCGIELGYHGDHGINGARGSRKSFSKIGAKVVIGHGHSPGICEGAYQTGTNSRLGLEYQRGPSSWLHTDCAVYGNGKRTLINIIGGEWRL